MTETHVQLLDKASIVSSLFPFVIVSFTIVKCSAYRVVVASAIRYTTVAKAIHYMIRSTNATITLRCVVLRVGSD